MTVTPCAENGRPANPGYFYGSVWKLSDLVYLLYFIAGVLGLNLLVAAWGPDPAVPGLKLALLAPFLLLEIGLPFWILSHGRSRSGSRPGWADRSRDCGVGCLGYLLILPVLISVAILLSPWETDTLGNRLSLLREGGYFSQIALAVIAFTVVPICEEVFFRGFVYNALRSRFPVSASLLIQAFLFGILHPYSLTYPIYIFAVGLGLGIVYQLRKRLLAPIITHCCFNAVGASLILAATVLNHHVPSRTWEEARRAVAPPQWLVDQFEIAVAEFGAAETEAQLEELFGEQGLKTWKIEAVCRRALGEALAVEDERRPALLSRSAELFELGGDPRAAALLAKKVLDKYPDDDEIVARARRVYENATALLGEEPSQ